MPWKAFMQSSALTNSDNVEHTLVNHQYSVPTIYQRVSRTSIFE